MKKALFLDRDGVVNEEINYLHKIEDFKFIDGIFAACQFFAAQGYLIVIITNQSGIARGYYSEQDYRLLTDWMSRQFANQGIDLAGVYHCPHHPDHGADCDCRKPKPGMIFKAQADLNIDLANSLLVGDKKSDMQAAENAGIAQRVLVNTGHELSPEDRQEAIVTLDSIKDLPDWYRLNMLP